MPPSVRFSREKILDAAFELVRREGFEAMNARSLAQKLGCSTQPLMQQFGSMEALRQAVYARADAFHTAFLTEPPEPGVQPMLSVGMRYIRFAHEEKALFRLLFQSDHFSGQSLEALVSAPEISGLLTILAECGGLSPDQAREVFTALFAAVHGCASLLANNAMPFDEAAMSAMLTRLYDSLLAEANPPERP